MTFLKTLENNDSTIQLKSNNNEKSKMPPDWQFIVLLLNQGRFMFLIPFVSQYQTFFKTLGVICGIISVPLIYKLLILRLKYFDKYPSAILTMDILNVCAGAICLVIFCITANFHKEKWQNLEKSVLKSEKQLENKGFSVKKYRFLWKYFLLHGVYVTVHGSQMFIWILDDRMDLIYSYLEFRVVHYWTGVTAVLFYQWLMFLKRRYNYIDKYIKGLFSKRIIIARNVVVELRAVGEIYKDLATISSDLNDVFIVHILFLILTSIMLTLNELSFAIVYLNGLRTTLPAAVVHVSMFFANVVALVISYEKLRRSSGNVIRTCLFLQEEMVQSDLRSELWYLAEYMKQLRPKISVVGFFEMDFQLISGYISFVISYLIIILQFNISYF